MNIGYHLLKNFFNLEKKYNLKPVWSGVILSNFKISVIVPVYNEENCINGTMDSLIRQSIFKDLEILLIDDGSSDNSLKILEEYSENYDNIFSYHKENEGLTFTRNYGIDHANGEYIAFFDADDLIPEHAYENLYNLAAKYGHDIVSGHFSRFNDEKTWREFISKTISDKITQTIECTTFEQCKILTWDSVVWNKLYKTSFLKQNNIRFPHERITFEDNVFSIEAYLSAESVGFLNEDVYYWRENEPNTSLSTSKEEVSFTDRVKIMNMVNECMLEHGCSEDILHKKYEKWLRIDLHSMALLILEVDECLRDDFISMMRQVLDLGPVELVDGMSKYFKLLYKIILNGNLEDLVEFKKNPHSSSLLSKYGIKDKMNRISVIIPVCNGEKYLRECFDSIVNQTLGIKNIEVIVVDDSSTDNSVDVINEYVSNYPSSFKLIKQEPNQGSGPARNLGLKHVTNDFVTFLDCDDYISLDAYEKALTIFDNDIDIDLVMYKWEEFDENGLLKHKDVAKSSLEKCRIVTSLNKSPELIFATFCYIKVYSRRLFKYIDFPPLSYQDNIVSARVMTNANKIYIADDICCYYRQRSDSVSKEVSARNYLNLLIASKQVMDLREYSREHYDVLSFLALRLVDHVIYYICNRKDFSLKEGELVYPELKKYPQYFSHEIVEKYQENFPGYLQCPEENLWDIEAQDYHEYVIKHRCQKDIRDLKGQISKSKRENANLLKENKKLKKELKKQKKLNKSILNSRSWKMTAPLRKFKKALSNYKGNDEKLTCVAKNPGENLTIAIKTPNPKTEHHWGDYFMALSLKKAFEKKGFNVVIHEYEDWYKEDKVDIVFVLRGLYEYEINPDHINLMWNISHPELVSLEEYETYDIVFISSQKYAEKIGSEINTPVFPLLQCSDPDVFYPEEDDSCRHDILFVGIARDNRIIMEDILKTKYDVSVYGKHWLDHIDKKYVCGEFIDNGQLHKYYSSSRILLNDHWEEMRKWDFPSNRLFDALLSGAFVISDEIPSAKTIFKDSIVTYNGAEDLENKIDYYLSNPGEREKKIKKGREIILKNHTFDNRVDYVVKSLKKLKFI